VRIRSVSIEGFGPFKSRQFIDFRAFDADGLFLIAGETGVGKTSVLDAIAYALYNKTPRWDNVSATGASNSVRSDFCGVDDPTEVIVEFETNGREYRVSRSPEFERPKARGEGTTKQPAKMLIESLEGDVWVGKATKEREAAELVHQLLKLNKDEFLQVIMLAQGRFHEFLLANSEQRLELLSKLFGTGRFADYQKALLERRSVLKAQVESTSFRATSLLRSVEAPESLGEPSPGGEVDWMEAVINRSKGEIAIRQAEIAAAVKAEISASCSLDVAKLQGRRESAKANLKRLGGTQPAVDDDKSRLALAEHAERVRPLLDEAASRFRAWMDAESEVNSARAVYTGSVVDAALAAEVETVTEEIGRLSDALLDEQRAEVVAGERLATQKEKDKLDKLMADNTESVARLQAERSKLVPLAARVDSAQEKVEQFELRLTAAKKAVDTAQQLERARVRQLDANQKLTEARISAEDALRRFLSGQSAVLAQNLVAGEPCVVCGSVEHPAPARFTGHPIIEADLEKAQAEVARLEPAALSTKKVVDDLAVRVAKLGAASGDTDLETLERSTIAARDSLEAATVAGPRILEIDRRLNGESGLIAARQMFETRMTETVARLTTLTATHEGLLDNVTRLRGEFSTVKARREALVAERDAAQRLLEAIARFDDAAKQRAAANKKLETKIRREGFELSDQVEAALLDDHEIGEITVRVEQHAAAVSENNGVLNQPELNDLPDEVIPLDEAAAVYRQAQRAKEDATVAKAYADTAMTSLAKTKNDLATALAESGELAAELEVLHGLTETVNGRSPNTKNMSLESYYIAAELEGVLKAANARFRTLSRGQFEFRHTERGARRANTSAGLEIEVFDEYTGTARPANQLSGGQQFLASLALALGLAEVVTSRAGGIELNTLFVDEGFGSLSTEYLEIAMETLDSLKQGGRTVGVISHVASMQEQIGTQLRVVAEPGGPSSIVQAVFA
jgi:exonuclease SbcC